ncbi:hypothetical protein SAMN05444274_105239 [Mariniphaga anaerophila]|uniref:Uncharacterized protein n=2 Tax=Mariniphaga anaerophila TaxID=1484053 RepID=A0A1M5BPH9_9BACT|nr:hypothetical protein SAMN05444274_105239 [Mariniphaga anaerophila]
MFVVATAFAVQLPAMNVIPVQDDKALIAFETLSPANFELLIKNDRGEILFSKKSDSPVQEFRTVFDLKFLENGNYKVCLCHGNCRLAREITISDTHLAVGSETRAYCPYYAFEDNLLKVSYLNNFQKNVFLNIYRDGKFVTGKKLGKEVFIQKALDLSKLEKGTYEVVLSNNNNDYEFIVKK